MKLSTTLLALACAAATVASSAHAAQNMRFGIEAEYPPFESKNNQGQLEGFDIDLGNAICKEAKLKCSWVENSFDGLIPALQAKKFDAINSAMNVTEQRSKAIDFTKVIYRVPSVLIGRKLSGLGTSPEKLKGKNIGVLQGSIQETYAKTHWEPNGVSVTSYKDQNLIYADMIAGRLDATLVMAPAGQKGLMSKPEGKDFQFFGAVRDDKILGSGIAFGLRKGDSELRSQLDAAIAKIQANGTVTTLAKKYFGDIDVSAK
jgi:lysine/arginine/ornithine transport system substrate-binding protein